MKKAIVFMMITAALLSACNSSKQQKNAQISSTENPDPAHNNQNSIDWAGVYRGVLPCADCEGIQEEIRLNDDLTYEMVSTYLGKGDGNQFPDKGTFEWDADGSRIKLTSATSTDGTNRWFKVGENQLISLDIQGNPIENSFPPETYRYKKMNQDNVITEKYWKLSELHGEEIAAAPENQSREPHFILKEKDSRVIGNTGCNNMTGGYELSAEGNGIKFNPMATTRMACLGENHEQDFLTVFGSCDNYSVENDTLSLKKGDTILAKFVAVYLR